MCVGLRAVARVYGVSVGVSALSRCGSLRQCTCLHNYLLVWQQPCSPMFRTDFPPAVHTPSFFGNQPRLFACVCFLRCGAWLWIRVLRRAHDLPAAQRTFARTGIAHRPLLQPMRLFYAPALCCVLCAPALSCVLCALALCCILCAVRCCAWCGQP